MVFCVFSLGLPLLVFVYRGVPTFAQEDICDKDRRYLDSCVHKLPSLLTYGSVAGIPSSKRAVDTACSAFRTGMQCFDLYAATCLSGNERKVMDANVAGARHTFSYLCDDPVFQQEYLQHTACYQTVSKFWDECANKFLEKVRHGNNSKTRAFDICCANHAFLDCVHQAGEEQCEKEAANFLRRVAEVLANVRVYDTACQAKAADGKPTRETCAACTAYLGHSLLLGFFFLVFTGSFQLATFCLG